MKLRREERGKITKEKKDLGGIPKLS